MNSNIRELLLSIVAIVILVIFGIKSLSGVIIETKNNFTAKKQIKEKVTELKSKVDTINAAKNRLSKQQDILKPFFKQEFAPKDSIASFGGMFEDIVDYVKINGLMLRSIQYNINPQNDLIFKNFAASYNVCEVKLFLVGTYPQFQSFIKDLNNYPYFINIAEIIINPYESNKKYLLAQISINLYSQK